MNSTVDLTIGIYYNIINIIKKVGDNLIDHFKKLLSIIWTIILRCTIGMISILVMMIFVILLLIQSIVLKISAQCLWLCNLNSCAKSCNKIANSILDGVEKGLSF